MFNLFWGSYEMKGPILFFGSIYMSHIMYRIFHTYGVGIMLTDVIQHNMKPFEDLYKEEVKNMKNKSNSELELKSKENSFVMEKTPMGFVIMTWNQEKTRFDYYADRKDIPYRFLDTVCRKYVKSFDCKSVYVDVNNELEMCKNNFDKMKQKMQEKDQAKKKDDMFASFKKYNEKNDSTAKHDELLIKDKINIFKYTGMIREFSFIKTPLKQIKQISYADFKI